MQEQNKDNSTAEKVAVTDKQKLQMDSSQRNAPRASYARGAKEMEENNQTDNITTPAIHFEEPDGRPVERSANIGSVKFLKGDFTENSVAQWTLPADLAVWRKFGAHVLEVLDEDENGHPVIPDFEPGQYTGRGLFVFVVREGHTFHDRNRAWDAYEADPEYRHFETATRWLGHWVRFAAVTPVMEPEQEGERLPHWK